ncbi:hypothetical protein DV738_g5050, partial [Chaetothyriales sp. CBS 135597]
MVTLRNRTTLKRPLKLRDSADEGTTTSEMPAPKRQKRAATATEGTETSTSSTKPKGSKVTSSTKPKDSKATSSTKPKGSKERQAAGERAKKRRDGKTEAQPESSSTLVTSTKSRGRKRKVEDATEPEKENDAPVHPAEAGKKPGRPRKRQAVQDIREAEGQPPRQKDDPLPAAKKPEKPERPERPRKRQARSATVEPSKALDGKPGTGARRTRIILRMPAVIPADVSELPMAEPEIPEFEEAVETDWPQTVPSPPPVSNRVDLRAVAGNAPQRRSTRVKANARQRAEEEEVPELSALAKAKLDSIRDFKVAGFRGEAPGKPDGKLKLRAVKKNKPVSAAEEVRQTERWARSFLQEQNWAESAAAVETRLEMLREKAKSCPRSKLAARRFKAKLRDWALRNGIQPAVSDAAVDEEVERARDEQYAFLEMTKNTRRDLEQLGGE